MYSFFRKMGCKLEMDAKKRFLVEVAFFSVWAAILYLLFRVAWGMLAPFVIGGVLAFSVQRPARWLSRRTRLSVKICAVGCTVILYLVLIGLTVLLIRYSLFGERGPYRALSQTVDLWNERILIWVKRLEELLNQFPSHTAEAIRGLIASTRERLLSRIGEVFSDLATNFAAGFPSFLLSGVVTLVSGCYFAKDFAQLTRFVKGLLKPQQLSTVRKVRSILVDSVFKFLGGYAAMLGITFLELLAGLLILRVRHAFWMALIIALVDILPVIGVGTVLLPWATSSFLSGDFSRGVGLVVLFLVITIARNFLEPHVIGNRVGMNPLFTLIAVFLGLRLGGLFGMIFLPLAFVTVVVYYRNQLNEEGPMNQPQRDA